MKTSLLGQLQSKAKQTKQSCNETGKRRGYYTHKYVVLK